MPTYIIKLHADAYIPWNTNTDRPCDRVMTRSEVVAALDDERLIRLDNWGTTSEIPILAMDLIAGNRAGPDFSCIGITEICNRYKDGVPAIPDLQLPDSETTT